MNIVEVQNLLKFYGRSRGITDVTFTIPKGTIFGFIGPNGAGKSTTIRILLSLIYADAGEARIFGMDPAKQGAKIRRNVGYIPAEVNFYEDMKVCSFLKYAQGFSKNDHKARTAVLCERLDLDTGKKIGALSSGNKKKVAIVQALLHNPELLILDEPTSGLDPLVQKTLYEILKEENAKGTTIFFSSHILSEVQKMCDRVAIIKKGRILKIESVETLRSGHFNNVRIEFADEKDAGLFDIKGAAGYIRKNRQIEFIYNGDIDRLMKTIAGYKIENMRMDEPELDEIFLHYYE